MSERDLLASRCAVTTMARMIPAIRTRGRSRLVEKVASHGSQRYQGSALRRLLEAAWIERLEEAHAPRDRVAYRLTRAGRQHLKADTERMKQLARVASLRLSPKET